MTFRDNKRREREEKRRVKKSGNKARRQSLKRSLMENPEEADLDEYHFRDGERSKDLNDDPYDDFANDDY